MFRDLKYQIINLHREVYHAKFLPKDPAFPLSLRQVEGNSFFINWPKTSILHQIYDISFQHITFIIKLSCYFLLPNELISEIDKFFTWVEEKTKGVLVF